MDDVVGVENAHELPFRDLGGTRRIQGGTRRDALHDDHDECAGPMGSQPLGGTLPQLDFQIKRVKHELTKQDFCEVALGGERRDTGRNGVFGKPEKAPLPRHTAPRRLPLHRKLPRSYADDLADGPR